MHKLGSFEMNCMLALLRGAPEATAADVFDILVDRLDNQKAPSFGALYTTLDRLADKGMVKVEKRTRPSGKRERRFFSITGLGQKTLSASLADTSNLAQGLNLPGWAIGGAT